MCGIYENSYLTIAATSSPDCHGGVQYWKNRELFKVTGFTVNKSPVNISLFALPEDFYFYGDVPLLHRAWALQERMMSPRVVHFMPDKVVLECNGGFLSESRKEPLIYGYVDKPDYHTSLSSDSLESKAIVWRTLIKTYSKSALSFPSDKFPAISGLARHMAKHRAGARYLAGLWSDSLAADLLWMGPGWANRHETRAKPWRAPSWSWASWDCEINYLPLDFDPNSPRISQLFVLRDVSIRLATADPTGRLSAASLTVSGQLADASICLSSEAPSFKIPDNVTSLKHTVKGYTEAYIDEQDGLKPTQIHEYLTSRQIKSLRVTHGKLNVTEEIGSTEHVEYALLLQKVDGSSTDYERVGVAEEVRYWVSDDDPRLDRYRRYLVNPPIQVDVPPEDCNTWDYRPSVFEMGAVEETIRIV